jgi:hypothetical protein
MRGMSRSDDPRQAWRQHMEQIYHRYVPGNGHVHEIVARGIT